MFLSLNLRSPKCQENIKSVEKSIHMKISIRGTFAISGIRVVLNGFFIITGIVRDISVYDFCLKNFSIEVIDAKIDGL